MNRQLDLFDNKVDKELVKIKVWRNDLIELHFDDYLVNRLGQVWSVKLNRFKKVQPNNHRGNYCQVALKNAITTQEMIYQSKRHWSKKNRMGYKNFYVHRIVACTFLNNPDKNIYRMVNHLDGNPLNNKLENLEWSTASENSLHHYKLKNKNQLKLF